MSLETQPAQQPQVNQQTERLEKEIAALHAVIDDLKNDWVVCWRTTHPRKVRVHQFQHLCLWLKQSVRTMIGSAQRRTG